MSVIIVSRRWFPAAAIFEDDFARADGGLISPWVLTGGGTWSILSNAVVNNGLSSVQSHALVDVGTSLTRVSLTLESGTMEYPYHLITASDGAGHGAGSYARVSANGTVVQMQRSVAGTVANEDNQTMPGGVSWGPGDVFAVERQGDDFVCFRNGVQVALFTVAGIGAGTYVGFASSTSGNSTRSYPDILVESA